MAATPSSLETQSVASSLPSSSLSSVAESASAEEPSSAASSLLALHASPASQGHRPPLASLSVNRPADLRAVSPTMPAAGKSKGRPKGRKLDETKRRKVIQLIFDKGQSHAAVAQQVGLAKGSVHNICRRFEEEGEAALHPKKTGGSRVAPALSEEQKAWLIEKYAQEPRLAIDDVLQQYLQRFPGSRPSAESLRRAVHQADYTLKRITKVRPHQNDAEHTQKRQQWCQDSFMQQEFAHAVFIDETWFNLHQSRRQGWAYTGKKAVVETQNRGKNITVILAVSPESGIVAFDLKFATGNTITFTDFLKRKLLPALSREPRRLLVLDNTSFHHSEPVQTAVEQSHHDLLFLPPYSPHLNLAEYGKLESSNFRGATLHIMLRSSSKR